MKPGSASPHAGAANARAPPSKRLYQQALSCVTACLEDFRADLAKINIPVLVIHGDQDRVLPYEATGSRLPALLKNARSVVIAGGPHAIIWTHADEVNQALLGFIGHLGRAGGRQSGPDNGRVR